MRPPENVLYADLPALGDDPRSHSSWEVFGRDDEFGTLNRLGAEATARAAAGVRHGKVFSLNWDVELPDPPLFGRAKVSRSAVYGGGYADDKLDDFHLQGSTQWDTLAHVCHPHHGFYNDPPRGEDGLLLEHRNGAHIWARQGLAGRFVLADVARWRERQGRTIDPTGNESIGLDDVLATLADQGTEVEHGDVLLLRFGWLDWYEAADLRARTALVEELQPNSPGLAASEDMVAWLWDSGLAAIAADNPGMEALPTLGGAYDALHFTVLALLGMPFGELFVLDELAADCSADGVYHGLITSAPLNVRGGIGTPANALCFK